MVLYNVYGGIGVVGIEWNGSRWRKTENLAVQVVPGVSYARDTPPDTPTSAPALNLSVIRPRYAKLIRQVLKLTKVDYFGHVSSGGWAW